MTQELILTKENVGFYLFLRDFLDVDEFSTAFYKVKVLIARNLSFQLVHKNGKKFFIKQLCHEGEHDIAAFEFEMAFYEASSSHPGFIPLNPVLPRLYLYDPLYRIAVFELLEDFTPANLAGGRWKEVMPVLVRIAEVPVLSSANDQRPPLMRRPEILDPFLPDRELKRAILQLNETWYSGNILHNDLKPENILVSDERKVKIVDWEKLSTGDALWDLAAVIYYSLPPDSAVYQASVASEEYIKGQSSLLKRLTSSYRKEWKKNEAHKLVSYLGLQMLTVITESQNVFSSRVLQLASDMLLTPERFLDLMFKNNG